MERSISQNRELVIPKNGTHVFIITLDSGGECFQIKWKYGENVFNDELQKYSAISRLANNYEREMIIVMTYREQILFFCKVFFYLLYHRF